MDASYEDILVKVGEDEDANRGGVVAHMDDLEVPPIANNEGHGRDDINENEDHVEKEDDYPIFNMKDFLW